ncbi:hypothetical protein [Massilia glaciei]|uniref:Uncharacterized protein n=1 Tax=Massilia glaciei TaxID=1524097 RepID=A0A2U2HMG8_9BURK|nr:hypothetical protein [Massilia glaciei]PWF48615.1 hypothetical protein C7C56_010965 [Massilia glaciei]
MFGPTDETIRKHYILALQNSYIKTVELAPRHSEPYADLYPTHNSGKFKAPPSNLLSRWVLLAGFAAAAYTATLYDPMAMIERPNLAPQERAILAKPALAKLFTSQAAYKKLRRCTRGKKPLCYLPLESIRNNPSALKSPATAANDVCRMLAGQDSQYGIAPDYKLVAATPIGKEKTSRCELTNLAAPEANRGTIFHWLYVTLMINLGTIAVVLLLRLVRYR